MTRPWQRRAEHIRQTAAECIEALAGTHGAHLPDITKTQAQYLSAVEQWARGELSAQRLASLERRLGYPLGGFGDILADVSQYPTHLAYRVECALLRLERQAVDPGAVRVTYAARLRELRLADPRLAALRAVSAAFDAQSTERGAS